MGQLEQTNNDDYLLAIAQAAGKLADERVFIVHPSAPMPFIDHIRELMRLFRQVFFPGFFGLELADGQALVANHLSGTIHVIHDLLLKEIKAAFLSRNVREEVATLSARWIAKDMVKALPELRDRLDEDIQAILEGDPAARDAAEVILCYPGLYAIMHYRVAHFLYECKVPLLPRMITELAHSATGIDIHPGARIGTHFAIDHGTGIVIGETTIIGDHVRLYQGVTLGAKNFHFDEDGRPINEPRHPILEDDVVVYSNASILGRVRIGRGSVVGGNIWITTDIPPGSKIKQQKCQETNRP